MPVIAGVRKGDHPASKGEWRCVADELGQPIWRRWPWWPARRPPRRPKRRARIIVSLKEAPDIASEFDRLGLAIADVGEPFVPYDVVDSSKNLPPRQFLRAYAFKDRTIAWYYHGDFGTHVHVLELREMADGTPGAPSEPVLRVTGAQLSGPPCRATQALLDGVRESGDW